MTPTQARELQVSTGAAPVKVFVSIGLPVGWVLLSIPLFVDVPVEPFVLGTLVLGLILPTVFLVRRDPSVSGRQLLRQCFTLPRPVGLLAPAALAIPVGTAAVAAVWGAGTEMTATSLAELAVVNVASSILIVNLWEEMVWAGYVQRHAMARWGFLGGSLITAGLFAGIHLPLAFYGVDSPLDLVNNIARLVVAGVGLRLLIGAFDRWGRQSILTLAIVHATFNASSELVEADDDWIRYLVTLCWGLVALAVVHQQDTILRERAR